MALPSVALPKATVWIHGTEVSVRSLSRAETMQIKAMADDLEACEIHLLMYGTDTSREEVEAFRNSTPPQAVEDLLTAISELSGFETAKGKVSSRRAKSTNGHSSTKSSTPSTSS